ncbi:hypothetical protein B7494_g386 [Chlorociboria aeruginascens]|nr:hypothetical protein B7494_g386 [Chlorociboria aeruginascens]
MPIFQDDLGRDQGTPPPKSTISPLSNLPRNSYYPITRKGSEESIRTELCEGLVPEGPENEEIDREGEAWDPDFVFPQHGTSDRGELIERLKKGESTSWLPSRNLESLLDQETPHKGSPELTTSSPLLPSAEISKTERSAQVENEHLQSGLDIERPRSALHSGDFTEGPQQSLVNEHTHLEEDLRTHNVENHKWLVTPPRNYSSFPANTQFPSLGRLDVDFAQKSRAPSLSSSYSSSFILKPPTSPLVQSESNDDLELASNINPFDITPDFEINPRRHSLQAPNSVQSSPSLPTSSNLASRPLPHLRRDNAYPYQAHQPRRSLISNPTPHSISSPQTPSGLRPRRPSYTSDSSPIHHATMVGSYEESILRGRMSTTPSKPLDFIAQIGVLGLGKCKSSLRCPVHVTIPFPAVFYSYETTSHGRSGKSEDGPSPYVGQIDLENSIPSPNEARDSKRKRIVTAARERNMSEDVDMDPPKDLSGRELRLVEKRKRRSASPRVPPGGSYRIPEKGQLQIIIKNPNKTAVKLFLIPYDLSGMEPGTKTFIRQRSYSAGPIIEGALTSSPQSPIAKPIDRATLRYLIHLHICSPSRGRYYLYKSIRVVFANRVPDGKEKLRNEISLPEPRFTIYKPGRDPSLSLAIGSAGATLAAEKAYRRRSSGFGLGTPSQPYDAMDGITQAFEKGVGGNSAFIQSGNSSTTPVQPIPFGIFREPTRAADDLAIPGNELQSPTSSKSSRPPTSQGSAMSWSSNGTGICLYDKLNKGDVGYGGHAFVGQDGKQMAEGLLAKKLRDLGVGLPSQPDQLDGL